jgi:DNA-binding transcriptional MerR regulator
MSVASTGAAARNRSGATLTIGDVLAQLKGEFPDLTISKIRFLEDQGLVHPERTPSGYRKFAVADVERLKYVLSQQKYHYLPLKVIKDQLEAIDRGLVPPGAGTAAPRAAHVTVAAIQDNAPTAEHFRPAPAALRLSREELLNSAGLRAEQLRELEQFGLITARPRRALRRRRAGRRHDRRRAGQVRPRGASPARVPHRRRARGGAVLAGRRADLAAEEQRGQGTRRGDRPRARRAVRAAARGAGADRAARGDRRRLSTALGSVRPSARPRSRRV